MQEARRQIEKKWIWILTWLCVAACWAPAQEIIPVEEIEPGMVGYGLSVFQGNRIERFQVEVIDILGNFIAGESVILVRLGSLHGSFDIESSGIIQGMSGSPIYLDGRLAGALSMGWAFSSEPIAGVTPIEAMLEVAERPVAEGLGSVWERAEMVPAGAPAHESGGLVPLGMPLVVSGMSPATFAELHRDFARYGWFPVQGGNGRGRARNKEDYELVPGAAIGVQLMRGDMDFTGIGTVTWVDGNKVLAFGHSLFNMGDAALPITTAHICTIVSSPRISFKVGVPVENVGSLLHDRLMAIYGELGTKHSLLPVEIDIRNKSNRIERTFHVEVAKHPRYTLPLCQLAVKEFIKLQEAVCGDNTSWVRCAIFIKDREPVIWESTYADRMELKQKFLEPLKFMYENPFAVVDVERVKLEIEMVPELHAAAISSLRLSTRQASPGETVVARIGIRPFFQKREQYLTAEIALPRDILPGTYTIVACSGEKFTLPAFTPHDLDEFLQFLRDANRYKADQVVLGVSLPTRLVMSCRGRELEELPGSVIGNLLPSNSSMDVEIRNEIYTQVVDTPYVIGGEANITLEIEKEGEEQ